MPLYIKSDTVQYESEQYDGENLDVIRELVGLDNMLLKGSVLGVFTVVVPPGSWVVMLDGEFVEVVADEDFSSAYNEAVV